MKARSIFLLCSLLVLILPGLVPAQVAAVPADSRITEVTVYADRALVTREATVHLKAGNNLVTFEDLPVLMMEDSLRARGRGSGPARLAGVTVRNVYLERTPGKRVRELEDEITALTGKVEGLDARKKALVSQRAFVESIKVGWGERISKEIGYGRPTAAELGEAAKFVVESVAKIEEQLYEAESAKRPLLDRVAALKSELEQLRGEGMKEARSVTVAVEAQKEMKFELALSYLVAQASWQPAYDVRLSADGGSAELAYRAQVWQRTGEEWQGVKLSLSTAAPELGGGAPELSPWHVYLYEPPRPLPYPLRSKAAMAPAPAEAAVSGIVREDAAEDRFEPAPHLQAEVARGQTSVLFQVARPATVPADGTRAGSVIVVQRIPVRPEYVTVPKLSPRVYLKTAVTNDTAYPLLPGEAEIFNDAVFVGKSRIDAVAQGEEFDLYFGADDRIKVKREVSKVSRKARLLGSNSVTYRVGIEVENFKGERVVVSLLDQKPVAGNAEIRVELEDVQPGPAEIKEDGTLTWKLELAPGEKKYAGYDLVIEYPKGRELVGVE